MVWHSPPPHHFSFFCKCTSTTWMRYLCLFFSFWFSEEGWLSVFLPTWSKPCPPNFKRDWLMGVLWKYYLHQRHGNLVHPPGSLHKKVGFTCSYFYHNLFLYFLFYERKNPNSSQFSNTMLRINHIVHRQFFYYKRKWDGFGWILFLTSHIKLTITNL